MYFVIDQFFKGSLNTYASVAIWLNFKGLIKYSSVSWYLMKCPLMLMGCSKLAHGPLGLKNWLWLYIYQGVWVGLCKCNSNAATI